MGSRRKLLVPVCLAAAIALAFSYAGGYWGRWAKWLRLEQRRFSFNRIYSGRGPGFPTQPTALLVEAIRGRTPGTALDVAMGQGRNSLMLAQAGWDVTGFDISDKGLEVARTNAERAGVKIRTIQQTCEDFDYGVNRWDLLVMTYAPIPFYDAAFVARLRESVRPKGLVLVETFQEYDPASRAARVPGTVGPNELLQAFHGFHILRYEEVETLSEWFTRKARIARLLAEKD